MLCLVQSVFIVGSTFLLGVHHAYSLSLASLSHSNGSCALPWYTPCTSSTWCSRVPSTLSMSIGHGSFGSPKSYNDRRTSSCDHNAHLASSPKALNGRSSSNLKAVTEREVTSDQSLVDGIENQTFPNDPLSSDGRYTEDDSNHESNLANSQNVNDSGFRSHPPSLTVSAGPGARIVSVSDGVKVDLNAYANKYDDEDDRSTDTQQLPKEEMDIPANRVAMARSAFLHRAGVAGGNINKSSRSNGRSSLAKTHVVKNNRGRGSRTSRGAGAVGKVLSTVRTAAGAAAAASTATNTAPGLGIGTNPSSTLPSKDGATTVKPSSSKWKNAVSSTVEDLLRTQNEQRSMSDNSLNESASALPPGSTSMGLLGDPVVDVLPPTPPGPGAVLACGNKHSRPEITVRSSIPHSSDDKHIANLRLSVFSRFDEKMQQMFRSRSLEVLNVRRKRGSVVLVAEVPSNVKDEIMGSNGGDPASCGSAVTNKESEKENAQQYVNIGLSSTTNTFIPTPTPGQPLVDKKWIIGSVECSHHEFSGTMLGSSKPDGSLMYVTEVAVCPEARRCGAGAMLMKGVDEVAALRKVDTIFLHVDFNNRAACKMYENAGYKYLDRTEPMYSQFTSSLNLHDGAMQGRKHHIMCKHVTEIGLQCGNGFQG